jgi:hypothetical protein
MFGRRPKKALQAQADAHDLGAVERSIVLDEAVTLVQTDRGIWLLEGDAAPVDLAADGRFTLESKLGRDRVHLGGRSFVVPVGAGARTRLAVAFGRLADVGARGQQLPDDPFVQTGFAVEDEWLRRSLGEGEEVLPSTTAPRRYLLTDRRAQLVAVSEVGDVHAVDLPQHALAVTELLGRDTVLSGEERWKTTLSNAAMHRAVAPAQAREGTERLVAVAAIRLSEGRRRTRAVLRARHLLQAAIAAGDDAAAPLARAWLDARGRDAPVEALVQDPAAVGAATRMLEGERGGERIAGWARAWGLDAAEQRAFVRLLRAEVGHDAALLPLHRQAWAEARPGASGVALARIHRDLAEHLLAAGEADSARARAESALAELSPVSLDDLVAPSDGEDDALHAAHSVRVDLIEIAGAARGHEELDAASIEELARLQPLEPPRIQALIRVAEGDLAERASRVAELLDDIGAPSPWSPRPLRPLPPALREGTLQHAAARGGVGVDRVQRWLAREVEAPDYSAIREFAERIDEGSHPDVVAALQDASLVLGQEAVVEAYVSRGARVSGVRACEGPPPFLLVGHEHLREGPLHLAPGELRFAVGAEVAHLRLGHARLTAQSVWDKVFEEGPTFLSMLADFAPFIPVRGAAIAKGLQLARLIPTGKRKASGGGDLAVAWGDLLVACRVMQLSADRAGLLLAGDLKASVRGMLLTTPAGREVLGRASRHGLRWALHRQDADGEPVPTQLALRVAALLAFWLSDEYPTLRDAISG